MILPLAVLVITNASLQTNDSAASGNNDTAVPSTVVGGDPLQEMNLYEITAITFRKDKMTKTLKEQPGPEVRCIGGTANCVSVPDTVQCTKAGQAGKQTSFKCDAILDKAYAITKYDVHCEFIGDSRPGFVVEGSCFVKLIIDYTKPGAGGGRRGDPGEMGRALTLMVIILVLCCCCAVCFSVASTAANNNNNSKKGRRGSRGGTGGGAAGGGLGGDTAMGCCQGFSLAICLMCCCPPLFGGDDFGGGGAGFDAAGHPLEGAMGNNPGFAGVDGN